MKKLGLIGIALVACLAGCTQPTDTDPTVPPYLPDHQIAGSSFPAKVAGYTRLGSAPVPGQLVVTYARDSDPLDLVVVSFDPTGEFGKTSLSSQQWYGLSRCGIMWKGDANQTPQVNVAACVTILTDGVMGTVSSGVETPNQLAELANAIYKTLA